MSVGEALAQARIRAGLTVEEVSERSLIRASVIASMESDDYDACGGPIYVNGYIRAIATAIGADPAPLIRSYAETKGPQAVPAAGQGVPGPERETEPDPQADPDLATSRPAADSSQAPDPEPADAADEPGAVIESAASYPSAVADPEATRVDLLPLGDDQPPAGELSLTGEQPAAEQAAGEQLAAEQLAAEQLVEEQPAGQQLAGEQPPAGERAPAEPTAPAQSTAPTRPAGQAQPAAQAQPASPHAQPTVPAGARPLSQPVAPAKATAPQPVVHAQPAGQAQATPNAWPAAPAEGMLSARPAAPTQPQPQSSRPGPAVAATTKPVMRQQAPPGRTTRQSRPPRTREKRRVRWAAGLAVLTLVLLGFAGREIFASVHRGHPQDAAAADPVSTHRSAAPSPVPSATSPAPTPSATPSASPSATQPAAQLLTPASAVAFGPKGTSDGDNPTIANRALSGAEEGWQSSWYATPAFGALKQGTGLLVDMGAVVSISNVAIQIGPLPGASFELRVGDEPVAGALQTVGQVTGAGGRVSLPLTPVKARYFLIWFTKLPPDGAGHFRATVDGITVQGFR